MRFSSDVCGTPGDPTQGLPSGVDISAKGDSSVHTRLLGNTVVRNQVNIIAIVSYISTHSVV